jgi:nucleoside-diphosphate-sugar epimerase/2-polyprenyl-3-methyl-5-hydroxy-6-metoxy-1,4-benzoquinol methylase
MNIIIGSNGFLGSYLSKNLENVLLITSQDYDYFIKNFYYQHCYVFICADVKNNKKIIEDLIKLNKNNIYILFSSAVIYYGIKKECYSENDFNYDKTNNDYVNSIKENEELFLKLNGLKKIIRLGTLYGSSPNLDASRGIHRMIYYPLINNYIEIYDKKINKSLTSFEDLKNGLSYILKDNNNEIYNLSSFDITIENLALFISNKFDVSIKEINALDNKTNYSFILNTDKLKQLGWISKSNLSNLINTISNNFHCINKISYDKTNIYYTKKNCRVCNSYKLIQVLNLNNQPPPNRLDDNFWELLNFPLILNLCSDCYHLQLNGVLNPIILYKNYSYLSGTSNTMKEYFKNFVESLNITNKKVLDIACNDCALLDCFKLNNNQTYGVDPAENLVLNNNNHNIYCGFFNDNAVNYFNTTFDIITAFNVFAHVDDIYDFLDNLYKISNINTDIFIQTSQCNMIQNNEFDTIYHEHLSFFNVNSFKYCIEKANFILYNVNIVEVHGSSYLFHIKLNNKKLINDKIKERLTFEKLSGIYKIETYFNYSNNIYKWKNDLINLLKNKTNIIGVGASAKGITILNFINNDLKLNNINISYIIDENKLKINKTISSINIKIYDFNKIKEIDNTIYFILFAWNFKDELISKINKLRNNNIFINLFPLTTI